MFFFGVIFGGGCYWGLAQANYHVNGGTTNSADTVSTCQIACQSTVGCIGIDFNPTGIQNIHCWLIFNGSAVYMYGSGATHYNYTCSSEFMLIFAFKITYAAVSVYMPNT